AFASLETDDRSSAEQRHILRIFAEALVGSSPALVVSDAEHRRIGPGRARRHHLEGGDLTDALDELRVLTGAEADVVGEDHRADDLAVAVDGVDAEEDRHAVRRALAGGDVAVDHARPVARSAAAGDGRA